MSSSRIPTSRACPPSSASTAPTSRSTAAASSSTSSRTTARTANVTQIIDRISRATAIGFRHRALPAAGAGPDHRRRGQPDAISVLAGGRQSGRTCRCGRRKLVDKLNSMPQFSRSRRATSLAYGLTTYIDIDRNTANRFGITPATIDNALYDSFGQRIVSTIFTDTNQYRVILETDPKPEDVARFAVLDLCSEFDQRHGGAGPGAAVGHRPCQRRHRPRCASTISASFRRPRSRSISGPGASLGEAVDAIKQAGQEIGMPLSAIIRSAGRGAGLPEIALQRAAADPGGHRHRLYRAGRALRELRASHHHSFDAAVGGHRRAAGADGRGRRSRR